MFRESSCSPCMSRFWYLLLRSLSLVKNFSLLEKNSPEIFHLNVSFKSNLETIPQPSK